MVDNQRERQGEEDGVFVDEGIMDCGEGTNDAASNMALLFRGGVLPTDEIPTVVSVEQLLRVRFRAFRTKSSTPMETYGSHSPSPLSLSELLSTVATSSPTNGDVATCDATDTDHA